MRILFLLAVIGAFWFGMAPKEFKAFWDKNPIVAEIIKEHREVEDKSKLASINFYYPYLPYFAGIAVGIEQPKKEWMEGYYLGKPYTFYSYYQKSVDLYPDIIAAHYLLGFCEYYRGDIDIARIQYEKSIELNPNSFWSYYNLGVVYFQQGDMNKSAEALNKAFFSNKEISLEIVRQGYFYRQIWAYIVNPDQVLVSHLSQGQKDVALLLAVCFIKTGGFEQARRVLQTVRQDNPWHRELGEMLYQKAVSKQPLSDDVERLIKEQIPVRLF